ncbi:YcnI family protein [Roseibium sp.]|uniref:YcnI family copper-binding membrane protein n=1 Tax=Roseibium sp. TaxID=1936156 RepID=UPI003A974E45
MKQLAISMAALVLMSEAALAHATFETPDVTQKSTAKMVLRVPHGCKGEPTLKVRLQIPEGIVAVKPMPKAGWGLETVIGDYANSYELHGSKITDGVKEIIWTGSLDDAHFDEFTFRGYFSEALEVGKKVYIPAIQECANGKEEWINIPAEGDATRIDHPAPAVTITEPGHAHH